MKFLLKFGPPLFILLLVFSLVSSSCPSFLPFSPSFPPSLPSFHPSIHPNNFKVSWPVPIPLLVSILGCKWQKPTSITKKEVGKPGSETHFCGQEDWTSYQNKGVCEGFGPKEKYVTTVHYEIVGQWEWKQPLLLCSSIHNQGYFQATKIHSLC